MLRSPKEWGQGTITSCYWTLSGPREACLRRVSGAVHRTVQSGKMSIAMIQRDKIEELLKLPAEERRRLLRVLQESLLQEDAARADEILRAEVDTHRGLTTN